MSINWLSNLIRALGLALVLGACTGTVEEIGETQLTVLTSQDQLRNVSLPATGVGVPRWGAGAPAPGAQQVLPQIEISGTDCRYDTRNGGTRERCILR